MAGFKIETSPAGLRLMIVTGEWESDFVDVMNREKVRGLVLNHALGFKGTNVDFLRDLPFLEYLKILDWNIKDTSGVHHCPKLRTLDISSYDKSEIDFRVFKNLVDCSLEWRTKAKSLFECETLEELVINHYVASTDLRPFRNLTKLRYLSLMNSRVHSLEGIEGLRHLGFVGLYNLRKLASIAPIGRLMGLTTVEIEGCRSLKSVEALGNLTSLKRLSLSNNGTIDSIKPLRNLSNLEELFFYETTNIKDGDLGVLSGLPKLKSTSFRDRPHYSHSLKEVESALASK